MYPLALLVSLLAPLTSFGQSSSTMPTCQQVANQTVFNKCLSMVLNVKGTMGAQKAQDQVGACYTQLGNSTAYSQCLCAKTSAILGCYDSWCQGDAGQVVQTNYQMLFCSSFHSGKPFTAMPTLTGIPVAPSGLAANIPTNAPVVPKNIGNATKSGVAGSDFHSMQSFLISTLLVAMMGSIYFLL